MKIEITQDVEDYLSSKLDERKKRNVDLDEFLILIRDIKAGPEAILQEIKKLDYSKF